MSSRPSLEELRPSVLSSPAIHSHRALLSQTHRESSSPEYTNRTHLHGHPIVVSQNETSNAVPEWKFMLPDRHHIKIIGACLGWYASSVLTSNSGKVILSDYQHPFTLTMIQFLSVCGFCLFSTSRRWTPEIVPLSASVLWQCVPLSIFQLSGHVLSSIALSYVSVSFSHTIKALAPLFTVLAYRLFFNTAYSPKIYYSLIPLTTGVILASLSNFTFHWIGFCCSLAATCIFVAQNIMSKKIFSAPSSTESKQLSTHNGSRYLGLDSSHTQTRKSAKLNKHNVIYYSSLFSSILMFPVWLHYEAIDVFWNRPPSFYIMEYMVLNCSTHFTQSLLAFTILGWVSPISYSIASLIKRIIVIVASIFVFDDPVSIIQIFGIFLTFYGLWLYDRSKLELDQPNELIQHFEMKHSHRARSDHLRNQ